MILKWILLTSKFKTHSDQKWNNFLYVKLPAGLRGLWAPQARFCVKSYDTQTPKTIATFPLKFFFIRRLRLCYLYYKAFFRKMQKLDLLEEVEETKETEPEMLARESSIISLSTGRNFPRLMPQLSMLQRDPESEYLSKAFSLKPTFQQNMLEMMSENLQLRFVTPQK